MKTGQAVVYVDAFAAAASCWEGILPTAHAPRLALTHISASEESGVGPHGRLPARLQKPAQARESRHEAIQQKAAKK